MNSNVGMAKLEVDSNIHVSVFAFFAIMDYPEIYVMPKFKQISDIMVG